MADKAKDLQPALSSFLKPQYRKAYTESQTQKQEAIKQKQQIQKAIQQRQPDMSTRERAAHKRRLATDLKYKEQYEQYQKETEQLKEAKKEIDKYIEDISQQQQEITKYAKEGYNIKYTDKGYQFQKPQPKTKKQPDPDEGIALSDTRHSRWTPVIVGGKQVSEMKDGKRVPIKDPEPTLLDVGKEFAVSAAKGVTGLITFPEFLAEEVGGRIYTKIKEGKARPVDILPFREKAAEFFGKHQTLPTTTDLLTTEGRQELKEYSQLGRQRAKEGASGYELFKRGALMGAAVSGEITGMLLGTKGLAVAKAKTSAALTKASSKLPISHRALKPTNIARGIKLKTKEALGLAKKATPEELGLHPKTKAHQLSFAKGRTPEARIQYTLGVARKGKTPTGYESIHATGTRFGGRIERLKGAITVKAAGRESPGLSVAPKGIGSKRFLRITGSPTKSGYGRVSLFPETYKPTTVKITGIETTKRLATKADDFDLFYKQTGKKILKSKGKTQFIAPKMELGGPEAELIIGGGKQLKRLPGKTRYTTIKGVFIEEEPYKLLSGKTPKTSTFDIIKPRKTYYQAPASQSLISKESIAYLISAPSKPSKPSTPTSLPSKPSKPSSPISLASKPSPAKSPKTSIMKPSKPSKVSPIIFKERKKKKRQPTFFREKPRKTKYKERKWEVAKLLKI